MRNSTKYTRQMSDADVEYSTPRRTSLRSPILRKSGVTRSSSKRKVGTASIPDDHGYHRRSNRSHHRRKKIKTTPYYNGTTSVRNTAGTYQGDDGCKPREEKSWTEFHPDLNLDEELPIYTAQEFDKLFLKNTPSSSSGQVLHTTHIKENSFQTPSPLTRRRPGRPSRKPTTTLCSRYKGKPSWQNPTDITPLPLINPKERLNLPRAEFRKVDTFSKFEQDQSVGINYVDRTLASIGFQETDLFVLPEHGYIRALDANMEDDLKYAFDTADFNDPNGFIKSRVEYDMDEQDAKWLEEINARRRKEQAEAIKPGVFEAIMTQIEVEWYVLEKRIPKSDPRPPQTQRQKCDNGNMISDKSGSKIINDSNLNNEHDMLCSICDDGDCENTNAIVFCDGCDLAVHQECYGVPFIPEGQWLCRKCQIMGRASVTCIFCPNADGAFKQTNTLKWAHLLCALWIPEVSLGNTTFMEPVMDIDKIPKSRWKLLCYICQEKVGACIQCSHKHCFIAFHATCARRAKLFLKMKSSQTGPNILEPWLFKGYCDRHVPLDWRREHNMDEALTHAKTFYEHVRLGKAETGIQNASASGSFNSFTQMITQFEKSRNRKKKSLGSSSPQIWQLPSGAPVVPQAVFRRVENSAIRFGIRKRKEFIADVCKYWTLKREARRGAALLKRLQLQVDAFTTMEITRRDYASMGCIGAQKLLTRINFADFIASDINSIKILLDQVHQRELVKLKQSDLLRQSIEFIFFPLQADFIRILQKALALDSKSYFDQFSLIHSKLRLYHYISSIPFILDLIIAIGTKIGLQDLILLLHFFLDSPPHPNHSTVTSSNSLDLDKKDAKKVAKRILKSLIPLLQSLVNHESDLIPSPSSTTTALTFNVTPPSKPYSLDAIFTQICLTLQSSPQSLQPSPTSSPSHSCQTTSSHHDLSPDVYTCPRNINRVVPIISQYTQLQDIPPPTPDHDPSLFRTLLRPLLDQAEGYSPPLSQNGGLSWYLVNDEFTSIIAKLLSFN